MSYEEPRPPLDSAEIDAIESAWKKVAGRDLDKDVSAVLGIVPVLAAELREARREIERLHNLPVEQEYCVAIGGATTPGDCRRRYFFDNATDACIVAGRHNNGDPGGPAAVYVQIKRVHPWVRLADEAPF